MTLVMGVDSSTQSCKVVITDAATGAVVREGRASHPDGTEVDPEAWWAALRAAIADAGGLADVEAWAIGGQQHGMVVLDADGRVIRDALLWNDTRSAGAAADLIAEFGAEALARAHRARARRLVHDHEAALAARPRARQRGARRRRRAAARLAHLAPARLRARGRVPARPVLDELVTDRSDASGTGYWNPATGGYDRDLLVARSATTRSCRACSGPTSGSTDADGRRVGGGAGDNAGAALGLGAGPGDVVVSIGTSGTVFAVSEQRTIDPTRHGRGLRRLHRALPAAGRDAQRRARARRDRARCSASTTPSSAASRSPPSPAPRGLALVPYFEGERTPNLPDATASLTGMTLASTTRENLARAAVEGMLCGLGAGLEALRALGVPLERALLIGGGAQSEAVRVIAPLVLGVPVEVPAPGEYVALGAARQAASVLG